MYNPIQITKINNYYYLLKNNINISKYKLIFQNIIFKKTIFYKLHYQINTIFSNNNISQFNNIFILQNQKILYFIFNIYITKNITIKKNLSHHIYLLIYYTIYKINSTKNSFINFTQNNINILSHSTYYSL